MVLKPRRIWKRVTVAFENDVKMYGTQTATAVPAAAVAFENDVKMYGTQTMRNTENA